MKDVYFYERQRFRQWWFWVLTLGISLLFIVGCIQQLVLQKPFGNNPMSDVWLIITTALFLLLSLSLLTATLITFINKEGVYVKFSPFHSRYKFFNWNEIDAVQIREYQPVSEFGGWGIRVGRRGAKAYNASGKIGMELHLQNKKKIMIGTNQPSDLKRALIELGKLNQTN